jgi:hypothetical protein
MSKTREGEAGRRFAITEETLSDGSMVYGVRFFCDYDPDVTIEIDCESEDAAAELVEALEAWVLNISVHGTADMERVAS